MEDKPTNTEAALILEQNPESNLTPAEQYLSQCTRKQYMSRNAYRNKFSWQQILSFIAFTTQLILHSVLVAPFIYPINSSLLSFFFIFNYIILFGIIGHYFYLTIYDPVDSLITNATQREMVAKNSAHQTIFCIMCQKVTKKTSYHCYPCGRCT